MTIRKRTGAVLVGLAITLLMGRWPLDAQEPGPQKPAAPVARKKQDPAHRVPAYFGKIGLTTEQRAGIYSLQAKRFEKIDALEKQIATERAEMLAECEGVLNETQKKLLENLRRAASEATPKATASSKPGDPPPPSDSSKPSDAPKSSN
jgi:hypothetical protein